MTSLQPLLLLAEQVIDPHGQIGPRTEFKLAAAKKAVALGHARTYMRVLRMGFSGAETDRSANCLAVRL